MLVNNYFCIFQKYIHKNVLFINELFRVKKKIKTEAVKKKEGKKLNFHCL